MADEKYENSFDDPRTRYEANRTDPDRLYADDREIGRSNASVGWIVGAVVLLGILVYAFGWKVDERTADNETTPTITTGQNAPSARPAPTPGPVTAPAPSAQPSPPPSTTGAAPSAQ